ncbi:MAG: hypothetical protein M3135_04585 [Actinomycetota bacterium]|nr:hypothetical protein [Actinomycetota bacterium]
MPRRTPIILCCLLLAACASDRVPLSYQLESGRRLEHRLTLRAEITRSLQGQTREQRVVATFLAAQEVTTPLPEGGADATFSLTPESLMVDGRPVDPGPEQEFVVQLGPDGRVVAIAEAGGQPGEALGPVGLERLLPRLRPVLPGAPVRPGDSWRSDTRFVDETGRFSLEARSRLLQLGIVEGHRAALVRTTYESPVDRQEVFANAVADLQGTDVGAQRAWFALDGFLIEATGDSVGSYKVAFTPPGGEAELTPVAATLVVRLHSELRLLSDETATG